MYRIGILGFLHESNTFVSRLTTLEQFQQDLIVEGHELIARMRSSHHEIGGFLAGLEKFSDSGQCDIETVPLLAARATPSGIIEASCFESLVNRLLSSIEQNQPLDGILVAAHGAAVSQSHPDADGFWLSRVRECLGPDKPIIATLDPHANLSPKMVAACNALIAYRTNPHLDQRERGLEAAQMMVETLQGKIRPVMAAQFPPLAINIERQSTGESHLKNQFDFADALRSNPKMLSNSILLGFPYADVREMGCATIAVADGDEALAADHACQLSDHLWANREQFRGLLVSVEDSMQQIATMADRRVCLLDMGDNVGGGSSADSTVLARALLQRKLGPALVCIADPESVRDCVQAGIGGRAKLTLGGRTDSLHGSPLAVEVQVVSMHSGQFTESLPRHGGITQFDQGRSAVVEVVDHPMTILITSNRMVPFSLQQLISCGITPNDYRILVAKGVHAPLAAYRDVCDHFIRVNTPGSTCADLEQLDFANRRRPLFPFEPL
jgi:microcystin degradation protein MlrC